MEFLEKFVIPQSAQHLHLLHYLAMLIFFLFVPFISVVLGGTILSLYYRHKGIKNDNKDYLEFSKEIIEIATVNKGLGVILGIVPVLTTVLIYAQLLHLGNTTSVLYLSVSFLLVILSLIFIYTYRYSTQFSALFSSLEGVKYKDASLAGEVTGLKVTNKKLSAKSGKRGVILLFISIWFFVAGVTIAMFPVTGGERSFLSVLFSWDVIVRFLFFISMAFTFTGGTILFRYFYWEGGRKGLKKNYTEFISHAAVKLTMYSALALPLLLALVLFSMPNGAFSGMVFWYSTAAFLLMFLAYNLLYSMMKNSNVKFTGLLYFTLILIIMASLVKDQLAVDNANQLQAAVLSSKYETMMAKLTGENKAPKVSGEEIFKNICSSCHAFDHKVVGPPYEQTLPKYEGKINQLIAFVLNPKQNNPGYPPMPNPGLKPNQAKAVANYIMNTYLTKYKGKDKDNK